MTLSNRNLPVLSRQKKHQNKGPDGLKANWKFKITTSIAAIMILQVIFALYSAYVQGAF